MGMQIFQAASFLEEEEMAMALDICSTLRQQAEAVMARDIRSALTGGSGSDGIRYLLSHNEHFKNRHPTSTARDGMEPAFAMLFFAILFAVDSVIFEIYM